MLLSNYPVNKLEIMQLIKSRGEFLELPPIPILTTFRDDAGIYHEVRFQNIIKETVTVIENKVSYPVTRFRPGKKHIIMKICPNLPQPLPQELFMIEEFANNKNKISKISNGARNINDLQYAFVWLCNLKTKRG